MTDLLTENARLRAALVPFALLNFPTTQDAWEAFYRQQGRCWISYEDIDTARAALATPAPDAVQEAARDYRIMAKAVRQAIDIFAYAEGDGGCGKTAVEMWLMDGKALRAIAGERT